MNLGDTVTWRKEYRPTAAQWDAGTVVGINYADNTVTVEYNDGDDAMTMDVWRDALAPFPWIWGNIPALSIRSTNVDPFQETQTRMARNIRNARATITECRNCETAVVLIDCRTVVNDQQIRVTSEWVEVIHLEYLDHGDPYLIHGEGCGVVAIDRETADKWLG